MPFFKKKVGDINDEEKDATNKEQPEEQKKVSIIQLFRYASKFDLLLIVVGSVVAVGTGLGFPFMSVIFGDITQSFINATMVINDVHIDIDNESVPFSELYNLSRFQTDIVNNCLDYVYLGIAMFIAATVQVMCFLVAGENMIHRMRIAFLRAILRQDIPWYDKHNSGTLTTKLFDNLERVKEGTGDKCALLIQFVSQFFAGLAIAFSYDWRLTLIMVSLSPFIMLCGAFIAKLMANSATREAEKYAIAGSVAEEVLTSIRTVVSFNGQEKECSRYNKALQAGKIDGIMKSIYVGVGLALTFLIIFSSYTLAFWVGTDYVVWGWIEPSTLLTVFFSVMLGSMAMGQAGPQFAVIGTAQGAAAAIFDIIDREPEIDSYSEDGIRPERVEGRIVVNDVRFQYPTRPDIPILKGVSFTVNPGETVALVGSSGCGKSTIVQLLLRYYNPHSGSITIDGHEISLINIRHLRNLIGVVSQEPILFNCSIKQNIMYGNDDISEEDIVRACRKANAETFIKDLPEKYETLVGDRGTQLSGGQKQRIAIARALVRDPKILLLDEATSALDAESESIVQEALEKASKGRTTLIIAHRLSTIRNADKIIAIKGGEVQEVGKHEELMAQKGLYYELVNAQVFADVEKVNNQEKAVLERQFSDMSARSRFSSTSSVKRDGARFTGRLMSVDENDEDAPKFGAPGEQPDVKSETKRLQKDLEKEGAKPANLFSILKYARPEWIFIIIAVVAATIQGCVFPAFSLFFTEILTVFTTTDKEEMSRKGHFWALMFLVLGVVQGVTMFSQAFFFGMSAERLTMRLRAMLFRNVMRMDIAYFDQPNHSSGKISTRLATDTPNVKSAIDYRLGSVFSAVVSVGCGIGIAFYYGWQMALLVVAIFPLGGVGQALQMKYIEGRAKADAKELENSGKTAMEAIENIRTVQALTLEDRFHRAFCEHLAYPHSTSTRKSIVQGFTYGFSNSIFYFLYSAAFRFGLYLIIKRILIPMHVMKVLFAISFTAGSMGFASAYFPEYIKARFAAGIIFKMLGETPKIDGLSKNGKRPDINGRVHFNDLHFSYPERPGVRILKGLNLTVQPGQTLALVGPSGCGKSTVISLLERFYDPLDGQVVVDSTNLCEINPGHIRSQMALVSQEPILFDCSIRENIIYGLDAESITDAQIEEVARLANIHKFISDLPDGMNTRVGEKGTQLSGGQKQRIAIARALIRKPKILLLDEATSALDTESEKVVQEALDRASEGRTCIIIAHRLATVVNADCIAVVTDGVVIEKGTHSELMNLQGAYYKLTQKQNMKKV
ncbi:hypothetical protein QR680_002359 [Steinernema hermaphroditum]|uniref:Uncharacterized protein n=1 Tax=Steinernema hermaphroditum TaxID=289476 RepID=A0AA39H3C0_9BILA|nr:hypothetical protein QR680_002359 [Steinernema hermaphroditum]